MGLRRENKKSDIMLLLCGMGEFVKQKDGGLQGNKTGALFSTFALYDVFFLPLIPICSIVH